MDEIKLQPLLFEQRDDFIRRNQQAFMKAAVETFGPQEKEVISREDILRSLDDPAYERRRDIHCQAFDTCPSRSFLPYRTRGHRQSCLLARCPLPVFLRL